MINSYEMQSFIDQTEMSDEYRHLRRGDKKLLEVDSEKVVAVSRAVVVHHLNSHAINTEFPRPLAVSARFTFSCFHQVAVNRQPLPPASATSH